MIKRGSACAPRIVGIIVTLRAYERLLRAGDGALQSLCTIPLHSSSDSSSSYIIPALPKFQEARITQRINTCVAEEKYFL